jgi:hypothetical protein
MKKPGTVPSTELFDDIAIESCDVDYTENPAKEFSGTDNPRHLRVIHALLIRPRKREDVDRIASCSNAPELVAELRRRGLSVPCLRVPAVDRDGYTIRFGVYSLPECDRRKVNAWLRKRKGGA